MYVGLSKEQEALRDELRAYYEKLLTPEIEEDLRKGEGVGVASKQTWKQMCADGWAGVGWPKEWGGKGMTPIEQFVFFDESMRAGAPVPMLTINSVAPDGSTRASACSCFWSVLSSSPAPPRPRGSRPSA